MTERRTALVTGANKGIGFEVARGLLEKGYQVWIGSRDRNRGQNAVEALGGNQAGALLLPIDTTDEASVAAAVAAVERRSDRLDVLVNNAGIATRSGNGQSDETLDAIQAIFAVNVFGSLRTTKAFLPLLRASANPRIVMVSSGLGSLTRSADPADPFHNLNNIGYRSSKSALNSLTISLAREFRSSGFLINAAEPGLAATALNGHAGNRSAMQGAQIVLELAMLDADGPTGGFFDENGPLPW